MRRRAYLTRDHCQYMLVVPAGFLTGILLWSATFGIFDDENPKDFTWIGDDWPDYPQASMPVSPPPQQQPLESWHGICNVIPIQPVMAGDIRCVRYNVAPHPLICFNGIENNAITKRLYNGEVPDHKMMLLIQSQLLQDPDANLIDINSIYGLNGLMAAKMGCHVIFVQKNTTQINMLLMSLISSVTSNKSQILRNVIHRERILLSVHSPPVAILPQAGGNQANQAFEMVQSVLLDDLMEVIKFERGMICVTVGLDDVYWLERGDNLFSAVYVPFIFMKVNVPDSKRNTLLLMFKALYSYSFLAYDLNLALLKAEYFMNWPNNIIWKHANSTFVSTKHFES